ncbi:MAG TPA: hypothetical protein GX513_13440 [Firmicutes bacterium]|nr:hypothetical protein [Bacillota bacterium]
MEGRLTDLVGKTGLPADVEAELVRRLETGEGRTTVPTLQALDWWGVLACLVVSMLVLMWGV